tara:strand:+ start:1186 stop:1857 length:672 start_codon:yes stop_codon:yes gene_type:complete
MNINLQTDWYDLIKQILEDFPNILKDLEEEKQKYKDLAQIYPSECDIFRAFSFFNINELKVVIIGQDPYHGANQANGLCFSVNDGIKIPPSLRNILKEMKNDCNIKEKTSGNLEYLAKQGVLLLNTTLTVREKQPNSHLKLWKGFTERIILEINENCDNIVFMLWGNNAKNTCKKIINSEKQHFLLANHPSPMSANRGGWFNCKHFTKTNEFLKSIEKTQISW